jgi:type IV secretion system protein VirB4
VFDPRAAAAGERAGTRYIRHFGHISDSVVIHHDGSVSAVLMADGFPFEQAGNQTLNGKHAVRAAMLRNIADGDVQLHEHLVQHDGVPPFPGGAIQHTTAYGAELARDYEATCLAGLRATTWLLTVTVRPRMNRITWRSALGLQPTAKDQERARRTGTALERRVSRLEDRVRAITSAMQPYGLRRLGVRVRNGVVFSEIAEAHRLVLYAAWEAVPLVAPGYLGSSIYTTRVVCGGSVFRIEKPGIPDDRSDQKPHGVVLGFRVYPTPWKVGMFDGLIGNARDEPLQFRFVLTNSLKFHSRSAAADKLAARQRHMETAGDRATSLAEELDDAMDAVERGEHVRGEHHCSLAIHVDRQADLEEAAATGRARMSDAGAVVTTEDAGLEGALFAQMPSAPDYLRARAGTIDSAAMAAMSSFHAHARGDERHHWGRPVYRMRTTGDTAYDRGWHLRDLGFTMRIGPAGSGKTTHMAFDIVMLDPLVGAKGGSQIVFDKDGANELTVRAMGGPYATLRRGLPCTAPLRALSDTPEDRAWLHQFIAGLAVADGRGAPDPQDNARLATALRFVMRLPATMRSIAGLREFLGRENAVGFGARLERWCRGNDLGWAFDADVDPIDFDAPVSGVDPTSLLNDTAVMPPMAAYLLHRASMVMDGRRAILHADEFRAYLPSPAFSKAFEDFALTGRKKNWSIDIATQQPEHILDHPIGPSIVGQCKTRLLYRNSDAQPGPYMDGLGCTVREFRAVSGDMLVGPHSVLIKREDRSVLCRFDLSDLPQHIAVLSGTERSVRLLHEIIAEHGTNPTIWLPIFRHRYSEAAQ